MTTEISNHENSTLTAIPLGLRSALESGECVLFVGSGIGQYVIGPNKEPGPDGTTLARELAHEFGVSVTEYFDLAKISEIVEIRNGRTELEVFVRKRLANLEPLDPFRWLFSLRWKAIFTTNYDRVIERSYELAANPPQQPKPISITPELIPLDLRLDVPIYHLHGTLFGESEPKIIITESDYAKFSESRRMLFELLKKEFSTSTILYVGYSNKDSNWNMIRKEIESEFYPSKMPQSYRISPATDPLDIEILRTKNIDTISATLEDFVQVASVTLKDFEQDSDRFRKLQADVPSRLLPSYERNPAAVLRLLASWILVNQAPFNQVPNTLSFLKGDRPNWGLIAKRHHFERDIEDELYEEILDYVTSTSSRPRQIVVIGAAGYGITTELMSIAVRAVTDNTGPVFMNKPGTAVLEGDIEFAASLFPAERPLFIIDNASDFVPAVSLVVTRLRDTGKAAFFLLGDRRNEWRQSQGRFHPKEFEVEALTDPEISRLLDCLRQHNALGVLESLDRDLQVATIKGKLGKDLLVTLREATEGNQFDAILEDEYRGIAGVLGRRLYLLVCGFYQHGAYIRDGLLADLMHCSLSTLYAETSRSTEGVVIHECIDDSSGRYAARARHRTIAAIVWERCGDISEKEALLQQSISALNLNYSSDKDAFEQFVRSDRMVDTIRSLEGKLQFFETACQKDPQSPYVRQHFARMLGRENKFELALSQIDEALKLDAKVRVLHHTKGLILYQLAMKTTSVDLARRRLVQSEDSFRRCIALYDRDEYSYQGLAKLYLDWAKRVSEHESAEYISRCEGVISEGLRKVRNRDGLRIVSADVEEFLGNKPAQLKALENAVVESPGSVIARYLLGRRYRMTGESQKAVDVLRPVIMDHPDEFRSCIEFALAYLDLGESYEKCIAIMNLGSLYGLRDTRFVGTLGGMFFMNRQFTEADKIFSESIRQEFSRSESYFVHFRPRDPNDKTRSLRLEGRVIEVRAGFGFIEPEEYPKVLCPGSKFGHLVMARGLKVSFELCFSAKGPMADRIQIV